MGCGVKYSVLPNICAQLHFIKVMLQGNEVNMITAEVVSLQHAVLRLTLKLFLSDLLRSVLFIGDHTTHVSTAAQKLCFKAHLFQGRFNVYNNSVALIMVKCDEEFCS